MLAIVPGLPGFPEKVNRPGYLGRFGYEQNELQIHLASHLMTMNLLNTSVKAGVKFFFFASSADETRM